MQIKMKLRQGDLQDVDFTTQEGIVPVELSISPEGSSKSQSYSMQRVLEEIEFLFKGVANVASTDIMELSISNDWFGTVKKSMHLVDWKAGIDKGYVATYSISSSQIREEHYVADAISVVTTRGGKREVNPLWLTNMLQPEKTGLRNNLIAAITISTQYGRGYSLSFQQVYGENRIVILDKKRQVISLDDIVDQEVFILFRLLTLIINKGKHMGVFLLDARGFSDKMLGAFYQIAEIFFVETFIFVYNISATSEFPREKMVIPNFSAQH